MANDLALSVTLGATMQNGFGGVFGKASKSVGALGKAMRATHVQLNQVQSYQRNDAALDATRVKLGETQAKVMGLKKALAADAGSSKLAAQLGITQAKAVKLSATLDAQRTKLRTEGDALRLAGIGTTDLSGANERLTRTFEKQKSAMAANYRVMEKRKTLRGELMGQVPKLLGAALFGKKAIDSAVDFESAMADVNKAVNFSSPAGLDKMGKAITAMSLKLPMARDDIAEIMAAGGMSGIAKSDLLGFAEDATKMGIAFDIAATDAGDQMAKWRTAFQLNQPQVVALADKINYLDNSTAASAAQISQVVSKIGALGGVAGLSSGAIAALGATTIGMGTEQDIAATGIKNLMLSLTAGAAASPKQALAFKSLGVNAKRLAQHMQTDAGGAIIGLLEKIKRLPKAMQAATLTQLFGRESVAAIAPMLSNLDELKKNLQAVGDATKYSGSMQQEYLSRASTTANALQLGKNAWTAITGAMGNVFLPTIKVVVGKFITFAQAVVNFSNKFPRLTAVLVGATVAFVSFNTAVIGLKLLGTFLPSVRTFGGLLRFLVPGFGLATKGVMLLGGALRAVGVAMLTTPLGWIIGAIALVAVGAYEVYQHWDTVKNALGATWSAIGNAVDAVAGGIAKAWTGAVNVVGALWHGYLNLWLGIGRGIINGVSTAVHFVGRAWHGVIDTIKGLWTGFKHVVGEVIGWIVGKIDWVLGKWDAVKTTVGDIGTAAQKIGMTQGSSMALAMPAGMGITGIGLTAGSRIASSFFGGSSDSPTKPAAKPIPKPRAGTVTQNYTGGPTTITVHAAPGMDERALAVHVRKQLDERDRAQAARRRSALSDID